MVGYLRMAAMGLDVRSDINEGLTCFFQNFAENRRIRPAVFPGGAVARHVVDVEKKKKKEKKIMIFSLGKIIW